MPLIFFTFSRALRRAWRLDLTDTSPSPPLQARNKLLKALECRRASHADTLAVSSVEQAFSTGSVYWHGFDPEGQPVVWFHPARKDWSHINEDEQINMHVLLLEYGIKVR
eukprot:1721224-Pyramimonas_sp.AAC.1